MAKAAVIAFTQACQENEALLRLGQLWKSQTEFRRGILKLQSLREIHLHELQNGLDSSLRAESNIATFRARLGNSRDATLSDIFVDHDKFGNQDGSKFKGRVKTKTSNDRIQIDTHRWLNILDKFADGIYGLNAPSDFPPGYLTHPSLPPELRKNVTVALIDDGASFMHRAIADKIEIGRSFDDSYDDSDLSSAPEPFHGSTTGHDTYMAYMIGRVCPKVKIFVCKLNMLRQGSAKANFTAKSAADAVEFAVNRRFDIISISWTVQRTDDPKYNNTIEISRLQGALERAVKAGILIFCSAPDIGTSNEQTLSTYYPFGCSTISKSIFKIGAAKADGSTYGWTGDSSSVDFILPGHNVELRDGDKIVEEDDTPKTGSSVATALAAGLAALIIHCVRLGAVYNHHRRKGNDPNAVSEDSVQAIKPFAAMKEAFVTVSSRSADKDRKDRTLEVENFFKNPGNDIHGDSNLSDEQRWAIITQLARDLISWNTQSRVKAP